MMYKNKTRNNVSLQHETTLEEYLKELESQGWKAINLRGKAPDAIAMKDGQIIAVEILSTYSRTVVKDKLRQYDMFDDVYIRAVCRDIKKSKRTVKTYNVDELLQHLL